MNRERLIEIMDLVLQCKHWGTKHRASLLIDNDEDHIVRIYPNVGEGGDVSIYFSNVKWMGTTPPKYVFDPELEKAEAHIKRLLEEIKMP